MELITEPGWRGYFTREQHPDAIPNGARVEKANSEPGDGHQNGTRGTILGSVSTPETGPCYFIEWDPSPRTPVFVAGKKVKELSQ